MDKLTLDPYRRSMYRVAHDFLAKYLLRERDDHYWFDAAQEMESLHACHDFSPLLGDLLQVAYSEMERAYAAGRSASHA